MDQASRRAAWRAASGGSGGFGALILARGNGAAAAAGRGSGQSGWSSTAADQGAALGPLAVSSGTSGAAASPHSFAYSHTGSASSSPSNTRASRGIQLSSWGAPFFASFLVERPADEQRFLRAGQRDIKQPPVFLHPDGLGRSPPPPQSDLWFVLRQGRSGTSRTRSPLAATPSGSSASARSRPHRPALPVGIGQGSRIGACRPLEPCTVHPPDWAPFGAYRKSRLEIHRSGTEPGQ